MSESLEAIRAKTAALNLQIEAMKKTIAATDERLARLEGGAASKFLADATIAGDWLPADAALVVPLVLDLVYFMYRECRKWPTVEQVVGQLQRDQRLNEARARQVLGYALSAAEPLTLDPVSDAWLVKIDPATHDGLDDTYYQAHDAWQYTEYPPERIK